jgi:Ala-tRNA(Pro) deacylase
MEDESTFNQLTSLLSSKQIQISSHEATRTSEESASIRGTSLESGAKAMLLKDGVNFVLAVMSASRKLDSNKFKKLIKCKNLKFASEEEVWSVTKCLPGAVPPFGSIWGVRTFMDESLRTQGESINFNAGLRTRSMFLTVQDYLDVERPIIGEFTK